MKIEKISINGSLCEPEEALINATDQGLMYGINAFESLRVHKKQAFLLEEHFDRLEKSLQALDIRWDGNRKKYYSWIAALCSDMPADEDAFIRFVVTAGNGAFWVSDERYPAPTVIIYRGSIKPFSPMSKKAVILKKARRIRPEYFAKTGFRIKSMDYISARLAKLEVKESGQGLDGILLTPEDHIAEGLTSNVFWSKDGRLCTPPLETGILAGTVRSYLISNNDVDEVLATAEELETADEIFLTSGSSYLNPLAEINGIIKPGTGGPVFKMLYDALESDVRKYSKGLV